MGAVSPAVVVPSMLGLNEQGFGVEKGIPTLVIAEASLDDVLAITGFGIVLAAAFSETSIVLTVFKGPLEALLGIVYGVVLVVVAWFLPHFKHVSINLCWILASYVMFVTYASCYVSLTSHHCHTSHHYHHTQSSTFI